MIGIWINAIAVILGGITGCLLRGGLKEKYRCTINYGLGLCIICIGLKGALATSDMLILIVSITIGSVVGEWVRIENGLDKLGDWAQKRFSKGDSSFAAGFVNATLLFGVGAMAIVGSLEAGLQNESGTLIAKSALDFVSAIIFASSLGPGVIFSAIPLTIYQGAIAALSSVLAPFLTETLINELSAVGSLMIIGIGLNMMDFLPQRIRVGNMLPAILIPCAYLPIAELLTRLF